MFRIKAFVFVIVMMCAVNASAATKAIRFGKLWDGHKVIPNAVVIVEGDKITSVTSNGSIPAGAQVIDMSRYTGMPGMIDAHTHITYYWDHAPGTVPRGRLPKPRHVAVTVVLSQENGMNALKQGVTTLRDLNASGGADYALRDLINMGKLVGPRLFVSGGGLRSIKTADGKIDLAAEEKMVRTRVDEGADWIKIFASTGSYNVVTGDQTVSYEELKTMIDTAHSLGHKVAVHSYGPDAARDAIRIGTDSLEHATDMDDETIAMMVKKGIYYTPTIDHNEYYYENAEVYQFPAGSKENLADYIQRNFETAKKAFKAGAKLIVGSDAVYTGFEKNMMREMTWFVKMGMTNQQALQSATTVPAEMLGMDKAIGSVAPGYFADIVALQGDPLQDINVVLNGVHWVMKGGDVVFDKGR